MESIKNFLSIKKIYIIPLIAICIFFSGFKNVYADSFTADNNMVIECTYSDGSVFSYSVGEGDNSESDKKINRTTVNLTTSRAQDNNSVGTVTFVKDQTGQDPKWSNHCASNMAYASLSYDEETDGEDGDKHKVVYTYFKFNDGGAVEFNDNDFETESKGWWIFSWESVPSYKPSGDVKGYLVSERVKINNFDGATKYFYKQDNSVDGVEQKASKDTYATIYKFDNVTFVQLGSVITTLDSSSNATIATDDGTIYLNDVSPVVTTTSSGTSSYNYKSIRFKASSSQSAATPLKFVNVTYDPSGSGADNNALCDEILVNSSPYLRDIIKIIQFLTPALMIVLCGLDIAKAVYSGNIDEQFPKIKKRVIVRLIVGVAVFFLPLVIRIVIGITKDSGGTGVDRIQEIECLFE